MGDSDIGAGPTYEELHQLLSLNLLLQMFDGVVTWQGIQLGFAEANPLIASTFLAFGITEALLLFKAQACGFLILLRRSCPPALARRALRAVAVAYSICSVAPWTGTLLPLVAFPS